MIKVKSKSGQTHFYSKYKEFKIYKFKQKELKESLQKEIVLIEYKLSRIFKSLSLNFKSIRFEKNKSTLCFKFKFHIESKKNLFFLEYFKKQSETSRFCKNSNNIARLNVNISFSNIIDVKTWFNIHFEVINYYLRGIYYE